MKSNALLYRRRAIQEKVCNMAEKIFLNDRLEDIDSASISVRDSGLLYGAGLFETMRSYNGKVFALDEHINRMIDSGKKLAINIPEKDFLAEAVNKTIEANGLKDARVRVTVTNGSMSSEEEGPRPTVLVTATEMQNYPPQYYTEGVLVVLCPYRQNPTDPTCGHKTLNYLPRMMGLKFAHERRAAEALWFSIEGKLAEGCISNVFLIKDKKLFTPKVDTPILAGVIRREVIAIAKTNSIETHQEDLTIDDVLNADEVFVTNSIMEIMPVSRIEKHVVGECKAGNLTRLLCDKLKELIKNQCGKCK